VLALSVLALLLIGAAVVAPATVIGSAVLTSARAPQFSASSAKQKDDEATVNLTVGGISEFPFPPPAPGSGRPATHPTSLVVGPDNRIWMTDPFALVLPPGPQIAGRLAAFDLSTQSFAEFDLPPHPSGVDATPHALTVGPDGNLWFTAFTPPLPGPHLDAIGAFDPLKAFDDDPTTDPFIGWFTVAFVPDPIATPQLKRYPHIPIAGPEPGSRFVYFTEMGAPFERDPTARGRMGRINVDTKAIEEFADAALGSNLHGLTAGPDGHLWVAFRGTDQVGRFNLSTLTFDLLVQFPTGSGPNDVKYSPFDNHFYVALQDSKEIGSFAYNPAAQRIRRVRTTPAFLTPSEGVVVGSVTLGPEGRSIWYTGTLEQPLTDANNDGLPDESPQERIGRLDLPTGHVNEFSCGLVPTSDPIEIIVGPDGNLWFTETNPGWLPPPAINPNPGKLARLMPSDAVPSATNRPGRGRGRPAVSECIQGSIVWSELVTSPFPQADVFVMNPDGTGPTNLTNFPGNDAWAAWSPDGTKIAFTSDRDGNFEIYVMNYDGTNQTRLTNHPGYDYQPTWSPDGTRIAYTRIVDAGGSVNADIWDMELNVVVAPLIPGSGNEFDPFRARVEVVSQTQLTSNPGNDLEPAWSPDGAQIAFTSDGDGDFDIYVMNADGSGTVNVTPTSLHADTEADWSPDGQRFVFTSNRDGNGEIYVMNVDGTDVTRLTVAPGTDLGPAWSPDGNQIVYTSVPTPGQDEIAVIDANGGNRRQLTVNTTGDFLPDWQPLHGPRSLPLPARFDLNFVPPTGAPPFAAMFNSAGIEEQGVFAFAVGLFDPTLFEQGILRLLTSAEQTQIVTVSFLTNAADPLQSSISVATPGADYLPRSGLLIFRPGQTITAVPVPLFADGIFEPNETFLNILFLPTFAQVPKLPASTTFPGNLGFGKITNKLLFQPPANITEFEFPPRPDGSGRPGGHPGGMVVGPDNNFWMTNQFDASLERFNPVTLQANEFLLPPGILPHFITRGPDPNTGLGNDWLWFTTLNDMIGVFNPFAFGPTLAFFGGITPGSVPHFLLNGNDGYMYFTLQDEEALPEPGAPKPEAGLGRLARMHILTKQIEEFPEALPTEFRLKRTSGPRRHAEFLNLRFGNRMHGLAIDAQGNLWAGLEAYDVLVRFNRQTLTFDHFVDVSGDGSIHRGPHDLLLGPDNKIYIVQQDANLLASFDPETGEYREFVVPNLSPADGPSLVFMTVGPDNNSIWFSEFLNDRVGRLDLITGEVVEFENGISVNAAPIGIVVGPDGNIWFSEATLDLTRAGRIARLIWP
jgi:TolB protein